MQGFTGFHNLCIHKVLINSQIFNFKTFEIMIKTSLFSEAINNSNIKLQIIFWLINNMENSNIPSADETVKIYDGKNNEF